MQKFSYHTHTNFSDGKNTPEEMILKAKELGWQEIGISDHLSVHKNMLKLPDYSFSAYKKGTTEPFLYSTFAEIKDKALRHFDKLDALAKKHSIKVLKGFEVDYFTYDGWEEELRDFLKQTNPDYLVNGNHFFFDESGETIYDIYYIKHHNPLSQEELKNYIARHFSTMQKAVASGLFSFLAHLDYARSVTKGEFKENKLAVIKTLAEKNIATEVSTKGLRRQGSPYPTNWIIEEAIKQNVPLLISDDAHSVEELGSQFDAAELFITNYKNRFKL